MFYIVFSNLKYLVTRAQNVIFEISENQPKIGSGAQTVIFCQNQDCDEAKVTSLVKARSIKADKNNKKVVSFVSEFIWKLPSRH